MLNRFNRHRKMLSLLLLAGILGLTVATISAASSVVAIELQNIVFNGCSGDIFSGSFQVIAYDSNGAVANASTPVDTYRYYATSYNTLTLQQDSTSTQNQDFLIQFNGAPITYGTLTVTLVSDPSVQSPTYYFDCQNGSVSVIEGLDDRINPGMGDLIAVLYARRDPSGKPAIQVYGVESGGKGKYIATYPNSDFVPYLTTPPDEVVEIRSISATTLYALPEGGFQINIGPDIEGKITSVIFSGLPPVDVHKREFNIYNLSQ